MNPYIFRKYDIRGIVETDFKPEVVRNLGNSSLKGIEYQKLTAILIEAVKELSGKLKVQMVLLLYYHQ